MANPNIVNVTSILGNVAYLAPANTSATTIVTNAVSSGTILKVNSLTCTNVTGNTATATVSVNSAAAGGGTAFRIASTITVPADSTLVVLDKTGAIYLEENTSVTVTAGTAGYLNVVASFEEIA
jgi:hypothetical protein